MILWIYFWCTWKWNNRPLIKHIDANIFNFVRDGPSDGDSDQLSSSRIHKPFENLMLNQNYGLYILILDTEFISGHHMTFERNNWVCRPLLIQCPYGLRSTKNSQKENVLESLLGLRLQGRSHGRVETREKTI